MLWSFVSLVLVWFWLRITFALCLTLSLLLFWNKTAFEDRNHCAAWTFKQGMTYFLVSVLSATPFLLPRDTKRNLETEILGNLSWGGVATPSFYLLLFLIRHRVNTFPYWSFAFTLSLSGFGHLCWHLVVLGTIKFTFWVMLFLVCCLGKIVETG